MVVVANVGHSVRHHPLELLAVEQLEEAGGDRHRAVFGVAAGGEGVGCGRVDHVDVGGGHAGADGHRFGDVDQVAVLLEGRLTGAGRHQRDLVAEPVSDAALDTGDDHRDAHEQDRGRRLHGERRQVADGGQQQHHDERQQVRRTDVGGPPVEQADLAVGDAIGDGIRNALEGAGGHGSD